MKLPITIIPNTHPPKFRWEHPVQTPAGMRVVEEVAYVAPAMERALEHLITMASTYAAENAALHEQVSGLLSRIETMKAEQRLGEVDPEEHRVTANLAPPDPPSKPAAVNKVAAVLEGVAAAVVAGKRRR